MTLAAAPLAQNVRLIRSGMLEVLGEDYIRTARAKGLAERGVIYRHALRNAALPVLTVTGLSLGFMLSGAIIIETVFSWPGSRPAHRPGGARTRLPGRSRPGSSSSR